MGDQSRHSAMYNIAHLVRKGETQPVGAGDESTPELVWLREGRIAKSVLEHVAGRGACSKKAFGPEQNYQMMLIHQVILVHWNERVAQGSTTQRPLLTTNTGSINHWPFVISSSQCIIPGHTENQNRSCHQYSVIHVGGIDRHLGRPEAEEQNDEHIDDGEQVDRGSQNARHIPRPPA